MKVISVLNMKGGVGKSKSTQNIAAEMKNNGKNVLVIDWDPQGDISYFVMDEEEMTSNTRELIEGKKASDCIVKLEEFDIIPTQEETGIDSAIRNISEEDRHYVLADRLDELEGYDIVIIDCPPTEGSLPLNALIASDFVFIPTSLEDEGVKGMRNSIKTITKVKNRINQKLKLGGVFATRVDGRLNLHKDNLEDLNLDLKEFMLSTVIPENSKLKELTRVKQSIYKYAANTPGAIAYKKLTEEILGVIENG